MLYQLQILYKFVFSVALARTHPELLAPFPKCSLEEMREEFRMARTSTILPVVREITLIKNEY